MSSDSDFTRLASRGRDRFIYTEIFSRTEPDFGSRDYGYSCGVRRLK